MWRIMSAFLLRSSVVLLIEFWKSIFSLVSSDPRVSAAKNRTWLVWDPVKHKWSDSASETFIHIVRFHACAAATAARHITLYRHANYEVNICHRHAGLLVRHRHAAVIRKCLWITRVKWGVSVKRVRRHASFQDRFEDQLPRKPSSESWLVKVHLESLS